MVMASPSSAGLDFKAGTIFGGYRIERLLGRGGMGTVYAAEQLEDGRQVAVKVLAAGLGTEEDRARFFREGRTAAAINHPNTVYVYRTEEIDGLPTITMELVVGGTLEAKVEQRGPLPVEEAIRDILQVVDGLDAAQRLGILHRDIKPANCFVGPNGEVKVGDFGLSRPVDQVDQARLTQTGLFLGTPVYSSPEQLMGETLDLRSDIYAVGATLYYLLSGKLPFDADNAVRLIAVVMSGTPKPLIQQRPEIPYAVNALVMKCLARARDERFADYASLKSALEACLPNEAVAAPPARRLVAGVVDSYLIETITALLWLPLGLSLGINKFDMTTDPNAQLLMVVLMVPFQLVISAGCEGRLGWTPGKLLMGLRVVKADGARLGPAPGAARGMLILAPALLTSLAAWPIESAIVRSWMTDVVTYVFLGLYFVRARRANGYLAEHDRLTGARVVRARSHLALRRVSSGLSDVPVTTPTAERVGPYQVTGPLAGATDVLCAVDPDLRRRVWLLKKPVGAAHVPLAERQIARTGCLRWLAARRTDADAWDAYAAIAGVSLRERLATPVDWREIHGWLSELVAELMSRSDPTGEMRSVRADRVFVSHDGHIVLLPFALQDTSVRHSSAEHLLADVSTLISAHVDAGTRSLWPVSAQRVLAELANPAPELSTVRDMLREAGANLVSMSRQRRLALWASVTLPWLLVGVMFTVVYLFMYNRDSAESRMKPLLRYLATTDHRADSLDDRRALVGAYVAGHFRMEIVNRRGRSDTTELSVTEWKRADSLLTAIPAVPAEQLRAADQLVDSVWHGVPPGVLSTRRHLPYIAGMMLLAISLVLSVAAALFARRGLVMRVLGLELINHEGQPAGRPRLVWRQMLVWLPILALSSIPFIVWTMEGRTTRKTLLYTIVASLLLLVSVLTALRSPARGLTERLSGTTMVPE